MGGGNNRTSPFTSVSHSSLERLPEEEIEELREQLQTSLGEHESVPGVTSLETSQSPVPDGQADDSGGGSASLGGPIAGQSGGQAPSQATPPSGESAEAGKVPVADDATLPSDHPDFNESASQVPVRADTDRTRKALPAGVTADDVAGVEGGPVDTSGLDIDPPDLSDADSVGELARTLFDSEDAISPRNRDGEGERVLQMADEGDGKVGGWEDFELPPEPERETLAEAGVEGGRTAQYMERGHLPHLPDDTGDYRTGRAFITHYDPDFNPDASDADCPGEYCAGHQMGNFAFCDALGMNTPRHVYDPDENYVAAEEFPGQPAFEADDVMCQQVDRDALTDTLAAQALVGNRDTHVGNIFVGWQGEVACVDLDIGGTEYEGREDMAGSVLTGAADEIESKGGPSVEGADIAERAQEIAVALHNSGRLPEVLDAVRDAQYETNGETTTAGTLLSNVDNLVTDARIEAAQTGQ
jgi:hypothetical protein